MGKTLKELLIGSTVSLFSVKAYADLKKNGVSAYGSPSIKFWFENKKPLLFAHRGSSKMYPENTLLSFQQAIQQGADGLELDVWKTKDNVIVIAHDNNLKRLCGVSKEITETNFSDLPLVLPSTALKHDPYYYDDSEASIWSTHFDAQPLLKLETLLKEFPNTPLLIDCKNKGDFEGIDAVVKLLIDSGRSPNLTALASFHNDNIQYIRDYYPNFPTTASIREVITLRLLASLHLEGLARTDYSILQLPYSETWGLKIQELFTAQYGVIVGMAIGKFVTWLMCWDGHERVINLLNDVKGIPTVFWVLDNVPAIEKCLAWGASGVLCDDPSLIYSFRDSK